MFNFFAPLRLCVMTAKQRKFFYFPAWHACAHANDWHVVRGRLLPTARREDPDAAEMARVWTLASEAAAKAHGGITEDHIRHACHIVALGVDKSANDLKNKEVNRVVD